MSTKPKRGIAKLVREVMIVSDFDNRNFSPQELCQYIDEHYTHDFTDDQIRTSVNQLSNAGEFIRTGRQGTYRYTWIETNNQAEPEDDLDVIEDLLTAMAKAEPTLRLMREVIRKVRAG